MTDGLDDWVGAAEAARYAGVSRPRIHQLVKANVLDARPLAGRLFVHRHSLEVWARTRELRRCWRPANLTELRMKRSEVITVAAAHGATNVRVFGSMARGCATRASDLDLVVDLEPGRNALDVCALIVDLEDLVGRRVDLVRSSGLARLEGVLAQAVPL